jgi:Domain of unknown function (DUF5658)
VAPGGCQPAWLVSPGCAARPLVRGLHTCQVVEWILARGDRDALLFRIAAGILILNLLDAVLTLGVIHAGAATEANPLMDVSLGWGGIWFIVIKLSLVSLGVQLLWNLRRTRLAAIGLFGMCLFYGAVVMYQLTAIGSAA